jgi:hypothetical protein
MLSAAPTLTFGDDAERPVSEGGSLKFPRYLALGTLL